VPVAPVSSSLLSLPKLTSFLQPGHLPTICRLLFFHVRGTSTPHLGQFTFPPAWLVEHCEYGRAREREHAERNGPPQELPPPLKKTPDSTHRASSCLHVRRCKAPHVARF
jgi:hypothetical protein